MVREIKTFYNMYQTTEQVSYSKYERLRLFLSLLNEEQEKFENADDALFHMRSVFYRIEENYAPSPSYWMAMVTMSCFSECLPYKVYGVQLDHQAFFLSANGAYAIYNRKGPRTSFDISCYYNNPDALVLVPSLSGKPLWQ